jgi:hypothetical protein
VRSPSDDAFISLRYAKHFAEGHGLVYNPGERVEGYTNFLWTVWLSVAYRGVAHLWIGYRPYYCKVWQITYDLEGFALLLTTGNIYHPLVGFITTLPLLLIVALYGYKQLPRVLRAGLVALMLHIVATILIARLTEHHKWPLLLPLFVPAAIWTVFPQLRRKNGPRQAGDLDA